VCRKAQCQTETGDCVYIPINDGADCDDSSACTTVDKCANGGCVGSESIICDDGNPCTDDYCHPISECLASNVADGTSCGDGLVCESGQCVVCTPDCKNKDCGDDGCDGMCGVCGLGEFCSDAGVCQLECTGCAPWQECVDGDCQDPESLGPCSSGQMVSESCHDAPSKGCCSGVEGRDLYYCGDWWECPGAYMTCLCHVTCVSYKVCGYDSWAGEFQCEFPPPETDAQGNLHCDWWECLPNCAGKECGDDGCGGNCGECLDNFACEDDACVWQGITECPGYDEHVLVGCNGLTYEGCCDPEGRMLYCDGGKIYCADCAAEDPQCGWHPDDGWYDCGSSGGEDPSGQYPKECTMCLPPCPVGYACLSGECVQ